MEAKRSQSNVSALKTASTDALAGERRSQKRRVSGHIKLTFMGVEHTALNWSQDGVLLADRHPDLPEGTKIDGVLTVAGYDGRYRFSAELVRRDVRTKEVALRFIDPSKALLETIARINE